MTTTPNQPDREREYEWVLVPREPTAAMLDRFVSRALCVSVHGDGGWSEYARQQWATMLAAASTPATPLLDDETVERCATVADEMLLYAAQDIATAIRALKGSAK